MNGLCPNTKRTDALREKSLSAIRYIFTRTNTWTIEIFVFEPQQILSRSPSNSNVSERDGLSFEIKNTIRPFYFEDTKESAITVRPNRSMISCLLRPHLNGINAENLWIQQNNTTCRISRETIDLQFPERVISIPGNELRSSRSWQSPFSRNT